MKRNTTAEDIYNCLEKDLFDILNKSKSLNPQVVVDNFLLKEISKLKMEVEKLTGIKEIKDRDRMEDVMVEDILTGDRRVCILTYKGSGDVVKALDDKVIDLTQGTLYKEFIDMNMDNPWTRVIVFGDI